MHCLTISKYARLAGKSRQSVQGKIRRRKLKLAQKMVPTLMIVLTDEELATVKGE
jgi:hypothetical protein